MNPSSPTPIHLDTLAVIEAARAAHAYGLLTAQAPDPGGRGCLYGYHGRVCAIGAALPEATLATADGEVWDLLVEEIIDGDEADLTAIQKAHDAWANAQEISRDRAETAFLRTLSEVGGRHG